MGLFAKINFLLLINYFIIINMICHKDYLKFKRQSCRFEGSEKSQVQKNFQY